MTDAERDACDVYKHYRDEETLKAMEEDNDIDLLVEKLFVDYVKIPHHYRDGNDLQALMDRIKEAIKKAERRGLLRGAEIAEKLRHEDSTVIAQAIRKEAGDEEKDKSF